MNRQKTSRMIDRLTRFFFFLSSAVSVLAILFITLFILGKGLPGILKIGLGNFLLGTQWQPEAGIFGVLPMIAGSLWITAGAVLIGFPLGLFFAIFLSEIASSRLARLLNPLINLLASLPSVVYGFFGLMVIVPFIMEIKGPGNSIFSAVLILSLMILPTVVSVSKTSLEAVPNEYREASYALGETKISTIFRIVVPAAKQGILTSLTLGAGRAIGEATAVILVAGNTIEMPGSIFDSVRTLTANCTIEMGYASGLHLEALYGTAVVLFVFIIVLNSLLLLLNRKKVGR